MQQAAVILIQPQFIHFKRVQGRAGNFQRNHAIGDYLRVVAHTAQQAVADAGCAACASPDFIRTVWLNRHFEDAGRAFDNLAHSFIRVEFEAMN